MRSALGFLLFVCIATSARVDGQQSRGPAPAPATGTGRIAGVVVDGKAQPVRGAVVRLTGADLPGGRAAVSDDNGRFTFALLPAGRFSLTSSKPAYLTSAFGAVRPGGTGTPVTLAVGEEKTGVAITMPHGGAITGTVRDQDGSPVPSILVYAFRTNTPAPPPAARQNAANTDDRGVYRIFGLAPGSYYVVVDRASSGGIGGVGVMSSAEVDATFARLQARPPTAAAAVSTERSPSSVVRPTRTFDPAPVLHPGVGSTSQAIAVTLGAGEERRGVDVLYQLIPSAAVSGSVSGAAPGQAVQLSLTPQGVAPGTREIFAGPILQRRASTGDGDFTFTGVTPGKYTLMAVSTQANDRGMPTSVADSRYATSSVEVVGDDIGGVNLSLRPTLRVTGRVTFPSGSVPAATALTTMAVTLVPPGAQSMSVGFSASGVPMMQPFLSRPSALVREDGTFEILGVLDGRYRLTTAREPQGWAPKTATLGREDILDRAVEITADTSGVEVTMTNQPAQISGRMLKADLTPAPGYFVIVFTADRTLWEPNGRRLRSVRPGTDGSFSFEGLPAGEYYLAALTEADSDEWQSPSFLAEVVPAAIRLAIADGEKKIQDLKVGK